MKVLIVDDNKTFLMQMKKYLALKKFDVDIVDKGEKALEMMNKGYDVILLDLKMPDLSGIEIMKNAKRKGIKTNFIVITGYGEVESAVEAMKLGAIDYIQKPFDVKKLLEILENIRKREKRHPFIDFIKNYLGNSTLLISQNPQKFQNEYGIEVDEVFPIKDLAELLAYISEFADEGKIIIHSDIELLIEKFGENIIKNYLQKLNEIAEEKKVKIIFACKSLEEKKLLDVVYKGEAADMERIVEIYKSPIRRRILQLLQVHYSLQYSQIMKMLDIKYSSKIAFHLKKLCKMGLIEKIKDKYVLTPYGKYMVGIFDMLMISKGNIAYFIL